MAEAKVIEALRPHTGKPVAVAQSRTSRREQKQGKIVPVEVPKLSDIPNIMDSIGWPVSEKLMRKWFAALAYQITHNEKIGGTKPSQYANGTRPDLIDTTTITMQWLLGFERARSAYDELLENGWFTRYGFDNPKARKALIDKIKRAGLFTSNPEHFGDLSKPAPWQHEHWQFQRKQVDDSIVERGKVRLNGLDDLFGALASFSLNVIAAGLVIPKTETITAGTSRAVRVKYHKVEITHVGVYVRDTYDFDGDQYLGHWGKQGVEIIDSYWVREKSAKYIGSAALTPADYKPSGDPPDMKLPVGNWSFRQYRAKHNKGGDLLVFSDVIVVKLKRPIKFTVMPEQVRNAK